MSKITCNFWETEETTVGDWLFKYLGKGSYLIYYNKTTDRHMVLNVDEPLVFPFNFRLERICLTFDDATSKDITVYHKPIKASPAYPPRIMNLPTNINTDIVRVFGENYKFQEGDALRFYIDGTTNKKCFPIIQVTRLIP